MAREIVAYIWCDPCQAKGIQEIGEEYTIALGNLKPRVLALCEVDRKELLDPLQELLSDAPTVDAAGDMKSKVKKRVAAIEAPSPAATGSSLICVACPESERTPLPTKSAFASHLKRVHSISEPQYRRDYLGDTDVIEQKCPDCEQVFYAASNRMSQVMGVHHSRIHE